MMVVVLAIVAIAATAVVAKVRGAERLNEQRIMRAMVEMMVVMVVVVTEQRRRRRRDARQRGHQRPRASSPAAAAATTGVGARYCSGRDSRSIARSLEIERGSTRILGCAA